jgi:two-component system sensor histidine kinase QseC
VTRLRRPASLQSRLLLALLSLVTMVWLGAALLISSDVRHELDELLDGHLAQAAALLVLQQASPSDDDVQDAPSLHKYSPRVAFQVFHDGRLVMRSVNVGTAPMSEHVDGFETLKMADGSEWRVFVTPGAHDGVRVVVGELTQARNDIVWAVMQGMLLPLVLALPLLALAGWWAVRQGLSPLRQLSYMLGQRQAKALEPVELADMPSEMQPMVRSLNDLFQRIERMMATERHFTADAAHELRTPIAAIRAQAQVALGAGDDQAQREHALHITLSACDRAVRLVEQLLMLARLEATPAMPAARVDLSAVARRVAADLAPSALARRQVLELDAEQHCPAAGDEMLITVLVRNLIDNAMRYSPDGARVQVSAWPDAGRVVLRVEDSGAGMTDVEMARLGERFYRVLGSGQAGSGLGWSIVKRIADVFGAEVRTARSELLGGLAVTVYWPPTSS